MSHMIGQTTLESLTEDINSPIKCDWVQRPVCGKCKVFLSLHFIDEKGVIQTANERVCAHCGQVNRLD